MRIVLVIAALLWTAGVALAFAYVLALEGQRVRELGLEQSRMAFRQVTDMRAWVSRHGGVYVPVDEQTAPNPYLAAKQRDVVTTDGVALTLINPAMATREIGEISRDRVGLRTHITSLDPLRPANAPSAWERSALQGFEAVDDEFGELVEADGRWVFRYMAPLMVEASCLECHRQQGYRLGDVRGGISLEVPVDRLVSVADRQRRLATGGAALIWVLGLGVLALFDRWVLSRQRLIARLEEEALVDALTGLNNRRGFRALAERQLALAARDGVPAALLFLDVDDFKATNDNHGHQVGDEVLRCVAKALRETFRKTDAIARFGGDEFVVLTHGEDVENVGAMSSRLATRLQQVGAKLGLKVAVRVSVGSSVCDPTRPTSLDDLLARADAQMYQNKNGAADAGAR